jgi:hypothetical protein
MDASRLLTLSRQVLVAGLVLASAGAMAGGNQVNWSVNIDAPLQGSGRISTQMSNQRGGYAPGYYAEPAGYMPPPAAMYAPPPRVVYAPQPVYYGAPAYAYGRHHHHHGARVARRVVRNVHNGLARLHNDIAAFHASRAQAWSQPGYGYSQPGYAQGYGRGRGGDWR